MKPARTAFPRGVVRGTIVVAAEGPKSPLTQVAKLPRAEALIPQRAQAPRQRRRPQRHLIHHVLVCGHGGPQRLLQVELVQVHALGGKDLQRKDEDGCPIGMPITIDPTPRWYAVSSASRA